MKKIALAIFVLVALAQLSVPALMAWHRVQTFAQGRVWKFKTAPVDPEDAVRGRFIWLRFMAEDYIAPEKFVGVDHVYAVLKEGPDGFAVIDHVSTTPLSGDNVMMIEPGGYWENSGQHIRFPFDKFWVTEKRAPEAEKAYRDNNRREKQNVFVTVRVRDGDAAMEQLYIDNKPLPEFLRAQAAAATPTPAPEKK
jgi:uncharacterized membrane-anchored protein